MLQYFLVAVSELRTILSRFLFREGDSDLVSFFSMTVMQMEIMLKSFYGFNSTPITIPMTFFSELEK